MKKLIIAVLLLFSSASASAYTLTHVYFKNHSDVAGDAVAFFQTGSASGAAAACDIALEAMRVYESTATQPRPFLRSIISYPSGSTWSCRGDYSATETGGTTHSHLAYGWVGGTATCDSYQPPGDEMVDGLCQFVECQDPLIEDPFIPGQCNAVECPAATERSTLTINYDTFMASAGSYTQYTDDNGCMHTIDNQDPIATCGFDSTDPTETTVCVINYWSDGLQAETEPDPNATLEPDIEVPTLEQTATVDTNTFTDSEPVVTVNPDGSTTTTQSSTEISIFTCCSCPGFKYTLLKSWSSFRA